MCWSISCWMQDFHFSYKCPWYFPHAGLSATSGTVGVVYTYKCITVENRCTGRFLCSWRQGDYLWGAANAPSWLQQLGSDLIWGYSRIRQWSARSEKHGGRGGRVIGSIARTKSGETDGDIRIKGQPYIWDMEEIVNREKMLKGFAERKREGNNPTFPSGKHGQRKKKRRDSLQQQFFLSSSSYSSVLPYLCAVETLFLSHLYSHQLWG